MRSVKKITVLLGGIILLEAELVGAQTISYLEFPPGTKQGDVLQLPLTLTLPCYGNVLVTATSSTPPTTYFEQTGAYNQSAPPFSWGTDANRFNVLAPAGAAFTDYTITFTFGSPLPVASRLFLAVVGLAQNTTATLPAGKLLGEFHFPPALPGGTSTTTQTGTILGSKADGDLVNTGWALYQPTASSNTLSVVMHQQSGDGVGWTLGYLCGTVTVQKQVLGAPSGFTGQFTFLVECMTPQGLVQQPVTINWPGATTVTVPGIPAGSTCTVVESQSLPTLPNGFAWAGTSYSPAGGVVVTNDAGGTATATNSVRPCQSNCAVLIVKKVVGAPAGFTGIFTGFLRCWVNGVLKSFPVTLDYPGAAVFSVPGLPQGSSCTFEETGVPVLPSPYQWLPPLFSTPFGQLTVDACIKDLVVTNQAQLCCSIPPP